MALTNNTHSHTLRLHRPSPTPIIQVPRLSPLTIPEPLSLDDIVLPGCVQLQEPAAIILGIHCPLHTRCIYSVHILRLKWRTPQTLESALCVSRRERSIGV